MLISCSEPNKNTTHEQTPHISKAHIEVLYFYGNQRCITCRAIEQLTNEVINSHFSQQLSDSTILLRHIDFSSPEGAPIADKYEVSWSSLFVNNVYDNHEEINNLTQFAFANARKNPDKFKQGLIDQINILIANQQ
ncbi:MAG: thioredoxin [Paludibacteraceae bacterium]|nr:thioredoxin [Paludibacteraceae bacterium]